MSDFVFSEHGEDIVIHRLLLWKENGFYIDCGAYHPRNMSLTARLRNFGWNGVNIDIDPRVISEFDLALPSCSNICTAISDKEKDVLFHRYEDPVLNTIDLEQEAHLQAIVNNGDLFTSKVDEVKVVTSTLEQVLYENGVSENSVDFLNLDIEGEELNALKGFPWDSQTPLVVAIEIHRLDLSNSICDPVVKYMYEKGYVLQSYIFHTAIFCLSSFDTELCHQRSFSKL